MGGEALAQEGAQGALRGAIRLGDRGGVALGLDEKGGAEEWANDVAREIRRRFRGLDEARIDQGSGAGLAASVRRKAIRSARCCALFMPP